MLKRLAIGLIPFILLLALPFFLREQLAEQERAPENAAKTIVIVTAHDKVMRTEFERAFREYYQKKYGEDVQFDWRDIGGTSDIIRYIDDRFTANFREYYQDNYPGEWNNDTVNGFSAAKLPENAPHAAKLARERFLAGNVGIGIDIMWGGGTYDMSKNAVKGYAVDGKVMERHPEYLTADIIPAQFSGEQLYDEQGRYYGVCLASFGICYNPQRYKDLQIPPPECWRDLSRSELFGKLALGDPTKSGSVSKCYEMLIQQVMQESLAAGQDADTAWQNALTLLKQLCGNANTITDSAGQIPREVSSGNSAAGVCIDYYGFTESKWVGVERLQYVMPRNGSNVSCDPIQLLRGAPNRAVAEEFIDFTLSIDGQKLLNYKLDTPGGPQKTEIRRQPIRRDIYQPPYQQYLTNPDYNPYVSGAGFNYRGDLTGRYFSLLRVLIRCIMLDPIDELRLAQQAIIAAGGPEKVPQAYAEFCKIPFSFTEAGKANNDLYPHDNWTMADIAAMRRDWTISARDQYLQAAKLAKEGK